MLTQARFHNRRTIAACAIVGISAPIVFVIVLIVQTVLQPGYSHVTMPISALSALPSGWLQNVNFILSGALVAMFAIGLHLGVQPTRRGGIGPALLVLSGVGNVIVGAFPWKDVGGRLIEPTGHTLGVFLAFLSAGIGFIVISKRFAVDPRWQTEVRYTLTTGIAIIILFLGFGAFAESADAPLHPWAGIVQRVLAGVWFAGLVRLGLRLWRVAT
jgi:hypothetical membrane protein